jgi:DNA-binding beta-propeller fold protein YncE
LLTPSVAHAGLTPAGCIGDDTGSYPACSSSAPGLLGPVAIELSPDGTSLYTKAADQIALDTFTRNAATGTPSFTSCLATAARPVPGCTVPAGDHLPTYGALAASPDGHNVYVGMSDGNGVAIFTRDASGALTGSGCVSSRDEASDCAVHVQGLQEVDAIAVSPDGQNVYALGSYSGTLVSLARNPTTGELGADTCFKTEGFASASYPATCPHAAPGMWGPVGLAVSPDGGAVYVASRDSGAVTAFVRSSSPGHALTSLGCISGKSDVTQVDSSGHVLTPGAPTTCPAPYQGSLLRARTVVVSPDSRTVTVASDYGYITAFARDPATSGLTYVGCIGARPDFVGFGDCAPSGGPSGLGTLVMSPDGRNVYMGGYQSDYVNVYARDTTTGIFSFVECIKDTTSSAACAATAPALRDPVGLVVSPDGGFVYAVAGDFFNHYGSLAWFSRVADTAVPPAPPAVAAPSVSTSGTATLPVTCPSGALEYCAGSLAISPAGSRASTSAVKRLTVQLAERTVKGKVRVKVRLTGALKRGARSRRGIRVSVRITRVNANGTSTVRTRKVRLRIKHA